MAKHSEEITRENFAVKLGEHFEIADPMVNSFAGAHLYVLPVLQASLHHIHTFFPDAALALSVFEDPDDVKNKKLIISIATHIAPRDAIAALNRLDAEWWLTINDRAFGHMMLIVEYK